VTAPASSKKKGPSGADKSRIRKIARRTADTTSSADVHVTDTAELKDAWRAAAPAVSLPGGFGTEGVYRPAPKAPKTLAKQRALRTAAAVSQSADEIPTTGVSYNPVAEAHAALIADAVEEEKGRLGVEARDAARTAVLGEVVAARRELDILAEEKQGMVRGMRIGQADGVPLDASSDEEEDDAEPGFKTKQTKRKTQAQRNKALRAREAAHALKLEQQRKKIEKAVGGAKTMGKAVEARARAAEEAKRLRKLAAEQRERTGFAGGEKVGRHRVAKEAIGVQLGEDLAESLRQIKVSQLGQRRERIKLTVSSPRATSSRTTLSTFSVVRLSSLVCPRCPRSARSRSRSTRSMPSSGSSRRGEGTGLGVERFERGDRLRAPRALSYVLYFHGLHRRTGSFEGEQGVHHDL
jgi:nucleolar protein 53